MNRPARFEIARSLDPPGLLLALLLACLATPGLTAEDPSADDAPRVGSSVALSKSERDWLRQHPTIRIGVDPEFNPYEFVDQEGNFAGIASDYVQLLNERLGINMEMVRELSWGEVVTRSESREIDVLSAVGMTEERQQYLNFSSPYISFDRVIVARDDAPFIAGLHDIQSWRLAVQIDTSHEGYLREHSKIVPVTYLTLEAAVKAVSDGEVDAMIGNIGSTTHWIRKLNLTNLRVATPVSGGQQQLHFAVRSDWPMLITILNKGLASINMAEQSRIRQRWFSIDYEVGVPVRRIITHSLQVMAVALLILAAFFTRNYRLGQEIKRRKRAVEELSHSEIKYRNLFSSSPDAILVTDDAGLIDCNSAALALYRCASVEAMRNLSPSELSAPTQADGSSSQELWKKMFRLVESKGTLRFEWDARRTDGSTFKAEITLTILEIEGKRISQALVQDITERQQAAERILYLANHDALTGLPSLRLFQDRLDTALSRAERDKSQLAVLFIDLDGFKAINDTEGHAAGDQVLKVVAARMTACVRKADTVARTGGDEFVILLPDTDAEIGARITANKVIETANLPILFEDRPLHVGASIGIALFPDHGSNAEELMRQADHAMYRAKADGKNTFHLAQIAPRQG